MHDFQWISRYHSPGSLADKCGVLQVYRCVNWLILLLLNEFRIFCWWDQLAFSKLVPKTHQVSYTRQSCCSLEKKTIWPASFSFPFLFNSSKCQKKIEEDMMHSLRNQSSLSNTQPSTLMVSWANITFLLRSTSQKLEIIGQSGRA